MVTDLSEPSTQSILRSGIKWWGVLDGSPEQCVLKIVQQLWATPSRYSVMSGVCDWNDPRESEPPWLCSSPPGCQEYSETRELLGVGAELSNIFYHDVGKPSLCCPWDFLCRNSLTSRFYHTKTVHGTSHSDCPSYPKAISVLFLRCCAEILASCKLFLGFHNQSETLISVENAYSVRDLHKQACVSTDNLILEIVQSASVA